MAKYAEEIFKLMAEAQDFKGQSLEQLRHINGILMLYFLESEKAKYFAPIKVKKVFSAFTQTDQVVYKAPIPGTIADDTLSD